MADKQTTTKKEKLPTDIVEITVPATADDEREYEWVAVNGQTWTIPKGEPVQVPRFVAEVLQNKQRMEKENRTIAKKGADKIAEM